MTRPFAKVLTETLVQLGLTEQESDVYQIALALGSRPASVIANKAGLKRGHTYNILQRLMEKGLVQEFVKNNVRHFTCSPPQALLSIARAREEEILRTKTRLEELIPELEKIRSPLLSQPKVRFYPGLEGMKEVYEDMLRTSAKVIHGFLDFNYSWSSLTEYGIEFARSFVNRREQLGIFWKGLIVESPQIEVLQKQRPAHRRAMRVVEETEFPAEIQVYGSKVAFFSTKDEYVGVVVENDSIAQTMENLFNYVWEILPENSEIESLSETESLSAAPDSSK